MWKTYFVDPSCACMFRCRVMSWFLTVHIKLKRWQAIKSSSVVLCSFHFINLQQHFQSPESPCVHFIISFHPSRHNRVHYDHRRTDFTSANLERIRDWSKVNYICSVRLLSLSWKKKFSLHHAYRSLHTLLHLGWNIFHICNFH